MSRASALVIVLALLCACVRLGACGALCVCVWLGARGVKLAVYTNKLGDNARRVCAHLGVARDAEGHEIRALAHLHHGATSRVLRDGSDVVEVTVAHEHP